MSENLGTADQAIRIILGTILIFSLIYNVYPPLETLIGVLGVYLIMSGYSGLCLIYRIFNLDTSREEKDSRLLETTR